jgi:FkbM family methyltransferase
MKDFLTKVLRRLRILRIVNVVMTMRLNGTQIRVPFVHGVGITGMEEPWMVRLLAHLLSRTPHAFVDVGVNLGQTLALLKSVDPARPYFGFEPNPVCVAYVHELIRLNRFEDCTIIPAALYREDKLLHLNMYQKYQADGTASIVENFRASRQVDRQFCVAACTWATVDDSLPAFKMGVVKIDVEGAEQDVLMGMRDAILRDRPVLLLEVLPVYSAQNVDRLQRQKELEETLRQWDYALWRVRKIGKEFGGLEEVGEIGVHGDLSRCDYVCVPREMGGEVLKF